MPRRVISSQVQEMFGSIAGRYDLANSVLSFGIHHYWRKRLIGLLPKDPSLLALDLCTGTGDLLPLLKRRVGDAVGADFCLPMLENAEAKLRRRDPEASWALVQGDALKLPFASASFDVVSVAFGVRNFEDLSKGL